MKTITLLMTSFLLLGITSCDKDDEVECPTQESHVLDGEWHLISVFCECQPVLLEPGHNVWTINVANASLTVVDNTNGEFPAVPTTGNYDLNVTADSLFYELPYGYRYYIENEDLYLDQMSESDGPCPIDKIRKLIKSKSD